VTRASPFIQAGAHTLSAIGAKFNADDASLMTFAKRNSQRFRKNRYNRSEPCEARDDVLRSSIEFSAERLGLAAHSAPD
jgi:hypothetical protein